MSPTHDDRSGYDSFWTAAETTPTAAPPAPTDAYAAFAAAADGE
ncbi:MAG: hypothetical protein U0804_02905 [Gemmataceae bacterium]